MYSNEDEKVTRRMNFHFQKKVEVDTGGMQQREEEPKGAFAGEAGEYATFDNSKKQNIEEKEEVREAEGEQGKAFRERMDQIYEEGRGGLENTGHTEISESEYRTEDKKPEKLIYHHSRHHNNSDLNTGALGKFLMDNKNDQSQRSLNTRKSRNLK
jgi:hypothetical protein